VAIYAKRLKHGLVIVNKFGYTVNRNGELSMHPHSCQEGEFPPFELHSMIVDDGFGNWTSAFCEHGCGQTVQVVRPGTFQCSVCGR